MITKKEVTRLARQKGFAPAVMEKDYALVWALKAVYSNKKLYETLVFKGGTCLSKVYAENYRLSEDLDFTISKTPQIIETKIEEELIASLRSVEEQGGPKFTLKKEETLSNKDYLGYKVVYHGPLGHPATIKLEISLQEKVIYANEHRALLPQEYSDSVQFGINCYALIEIVAEKIRAIMQRGKSRDYYDVWQLVTNPNLKKQVPTDPSLFRKTVLEKCEWNKIAFEPELFFDEKRLAAAKDYWTTGLARVTPKKILPPFEEAIVELKKVFFEEDELVQFTIDFKLEHLENINRGHYTDVLLRRAVELVAVRLNSRKKQEVTNALSLLRQICSRKFMPKPTNEILEKIAALKGDKDDDIQTLARQTEQELRG